MDHQCSDTELIINCVVALVVDTSLDHSTNGATNSKDVMVHVTRELTMRLANKNKLRDEKPRQVVNTTMRFQARTTQKPLQTVRTRRKNVSKQTQQREWAVDKMHVHCQKKKQVAFHSAHLQGILQHDRSTAGEDSNVKTRHCFLRTTTRSNLPHGTLRNQQT